MDDVYNIIGVIAAAATVILSICIYLFFSITNNYWKDRGVPFVKPLPLFGNIKDQVFNKRNFIDILGDIYKNLKGNRFGGYFEMTKPVLLILDSELVEKILIKDFTYFYDRSFPADPERDPLSANLFRLSGDTWRTLRYKLTPTFTTGKLKGMFEQISNCGDRVLKYIEDEPGKDIHIAPLMANFALDVIASCAFGLQLGKDDEMNRNFRKAMKQIFEPSGFVRLKNIILLSAPKFSKFIGLRTFPAEVERLIISIVQDTLEYRENNNINRNDFLQLMYNIRKQEMNGLSSAAEKDLTSEDYIIDQMQHSVKRGDENLPGKKVVMTDELIAAQSFIFLAGGSETVSVTIGYCLYLLAQHPQVQDKVYEEVKSALKQSDNIWSYNMVKEMPYLEQVIQETIRLYPPSPALFRECTQPYKLPGSNVVLEKGTRVLIPVLNIQRDPENYDSPEVFRPERFADNNFKPSGTYLPFGNGPRICIAMRFAVLEVKVVLARILSQYTVKLSGKTQLPIAFRPSSFVITPESGLWFNFIKRTKS